MIEKELAVRLLGSIPAERNAIANALRQEMGLEEQKEARCDWSLRNGGRDEQSRVCVV